MQYAINFSKVVEVELPEKMVLEWLLGNNGFNDEDYAVVIHNEANPHGLNIESAIGQTFRGRMVRITVETLE